MKKFRTLRKDEIDCRISQIKAEKNSKTNEVEAKGLTLLLYKDARCDQNILDETVGPMNWQRSHSRENANCTVSIWDDDKHMWVGKEDTGTESNTEKEKGLASDSFKRACFNWGIGRELYSAPFIWIKASDCNIKASDCNIKASDFNIKEGERKFKCFDNFSVADIDYDDNWNIKLLKIKNNKTGKIVFNWANSEEKPQEPDNEPSEAPVVKKGDPQTAAYLKSSTKLMMEAFGIQDEAEMKKKLMEMKKSLVESKIIPDVKFNEMTVAQAEEMVEAIFKNFNPNGDRK